VLESYNRIITGDQNIAACLNDYFATIGSKLAENITENGADPLRFVSPIKNDFCFKNINASELSDTLAQIKTKKSSGIDG
jgi:DNA primase